jgi:amphi-Trp domain-containing protein
MTTLGASLGDPTHEGNQRMTKAPRDVERLYSTPEVVAKLRRLADALEQDKPFRIQIAGERFWVPERAQFSIEHERDDDEEEVEFQFKWTIGSASVDEAESDQAPIV